MMELRLLISVSILALLVLALAACDDASGKASTSEADTQETTVRLAIEGMYCEGCVAAIEDTVQRIDGVTACEVSLESGTALVTITDPDLTPTVIGKIEKLKYQARVVE